MAKNHLKRINAPKRWDVLRKNFKFISRPNPGRRLELAVSLNTALKEMLGKSGTTKESKYLLRRVGVLVNNVRRYDEKFPVGFMDVVSLPSLGEHYRLTVNMKNKLCFAKVPEAEYSLKISKASKKSHIRGGKLQVFCTDGRTFLTGEREATGISTNDTILYKVPGQESKEVYKLEKGAVVFLYRGKHIGRVVKITDFNKSNIMFEIDGHAFETKKTYAFAIGKENPSVTVLNNSEAIDKAPELHNSAAKQGKSHKGGA
jgi:small subunit ribosomal protein S4e